MWNLLRGYGDNLTMGRWQIAQEGFHLRCSGSVGDTMQFFAEEYFKTWKFQYLVKDKPMLKIGNDCFLLDQTRSHRLVQWMHWGYLHVASECRKNYDVLRVPFAWITFFHSFPGTNLFVFCFFSCCACNFHHWSLAGMPVLCSRIFVGYFVLFFLRFLRFFF